MVRRHYIPELCYSGEEFSLFVRSYYFEMKGRTQDLHRSYGRHAATPKVKWPDPGMEAHKVYMRLGKHSSQSMIESKPTRLTQSRTVTLCDINWSSGPFIYEPSVGL